MPLKQKELGPYPDLVPDLSLADDLKNSPTKDERDCILTILRRLRHEKVNARANRVGHILNIHECHHIIEIYKERYIEHIKRDYTATAS